MRAWQDLGRRLKQTQSQQWRDRLGQTLRQCLISAHAETMRAKAIKHAGLQVDFDTFLDGRTISTGMFPVFHLIEYTAGIDLPDEVHDHPLIQEIKWLASKIVGIDNELIGLAKDLVHDWPNLVTVLSRCQSLPMEEAVGHIVELHNSAVATFDALAGCLPHWNAAIDTQLQSWVQAVRYAVHGFALWENTATRYQQYQVLTNLRPTIHYV